MLFPKNRNSDSPGSSVDGAEVFLSGQGRHGTIGHGGDDLSIAFFNHVACSKYTGKIGVHQTVRNDITILG